MESPSYEEENVLEDEEMFFTKLVDYPSSGDEDESQWLHGSASDTLLKAKCSSNLDAGEENMMEASGQSKTDCDYFFSDNECDDSDYEYETDREVLSWGPYSWRMADRSNRREVPVRVAFEVVGSSLDSDTYDVCGLSILIYKYHNMVYCITVDGESPRKESRCLELLNVIGCEERFLGCSVEMLRCFFANLNKNEAARLKGVEGVGTINAFGRCFGDI